MLLAVLLGTSAVQGVEIPDSYEQVDLWTADYLSDYVINSQEDQYAFILWTDVELNPSSNPDWTSSTPLVSGGQLIFTTNEGDTPLALHFKDGQSSAFVEPASLVFDTLSNLTFSNQEASNYGAAINLGSGSLSIHNVTDGIDDKEQADVLFSGNNSMVSSLCYGGAIYASGSSSVIDISGNGDVSFLDNDISSSPSSYYSSTYTYGGAVYAAGNTSISHNDDVLFSGNSAHVSGYHAYAYGGAIYAASNLNINSNGDVSFTGNYASAAEDSYGGAIYVRSSLSISGNDDVSYTDNYATSSSSYSYSCSYGGAIYAASSLSISGNGDVSFSRNNTYAYYNSYGGAIYSTGGLSISNNADVLFSNNYTASSSNSSYTRGGAIYASSSLSIVGNDSVVFEKNYEKYSSTYRLRGLYMDSGSLILSARTGGHITFYDSMYAYCTASLNADYTDKDGVKQKAGGDIIFSGQYTAEHLKEIKGGIAGTSSEITNSQTSEINGLITLYGGSLQVVDGAKLNGRGLTLAADSGARLLLRDGSMSHSSYNFTFNRGTTLELQGYNTITASRITMNSGSALTLAVGAGNLETAALTLGGTDLSTSQLTINLERTDGLRSGMYKIISQNSTSDFTTKSAWTVANVTVNGTGYASRAEFVDMVWENGTLYYKVGKNTWSNASGDHLWNTSSDNWTMNDRSYTYLDTMDVYFGDTGAGEVVLQGALAPSSIEVNNSSGRDYTFTAADSNSRLTGATCITKSGSGVLNMAMANDYTGTTELQSGTIHVRHSAALGATAEGLASVSSAAGTSLRVGNSSHLVLAASNSLAGAMEVESGATLEMQGSGYAASASTVSGTLAFTGAASATSNAGSLSGSGTVKVTDSQVRFESTTFTGNLEVQGKDARLELASGRYTGAGHISLNGGTLTFGASANLTLNSGGVIEMTADMDVPAELVVNNLNIKKGSVLSTYAELADAASLSISETVGYAGTYHNGAVGGVLDCNRVTLNMGSTLILHNAHFDLAGGALTLGVTSSSTEKIELVFAEEPECTLSTRKVLFSNLGTVNFIYDGLTVTPDDGGIYTLKAGDYFTGLGILEHSLLVYNCEQNVLYLTRMIPEPATTTLSLLALACLATRRRRR